MARMTTSIGRETLRQELVDLANNETMINEVYVRQTQQTGEPDLMGVTVEDVEGNYVIFNQSGSPGMGKIAVLLDQIIAIDIGM